MTYTPHFLFVTGLGFFYIYDLEPDPQSPILLSAIKTSAECQGLKIFETENRRYAFICNFLEGISIYDVTNPSNVFLISRSTFDNLDSFSNIILGYATTFDVVVDYPYAYSTLGVRQNYINSEYDHRGLLVWDIEDLSNVKLLSVSEIPFKDKTSFNVYDVQPTSITKYNNFIITNNLTNGFSVFDVKNPLKPVYYNSFSNKSSSVMPLLATDDGYLFVGGDRVISDKTSVNLSLYKISNDCSSLDDIVYSDSIPSHVYSGGIIDLPIKLKSHNNIVGAQFDIVLPDDIEFSLTNETPNVELLAFIENGSELIDIFEFSLLSKNIMRVILASTSNAVISGNNGDIISIKLNLANVDSACSRTIKFDNIQLVDNKYFAYNTTRIISPLKIVHPLGDANGDWNVSVSDYSSIVNYILEKDFNLDFDMSDLNKDNELSVIDLVLLTNLITDNKNSTLKKYYRISNQSDLQVESIVAIDNVNMSVVLKNYSEIDAFQFDVSLPKGVELLNDFDVCNSDVNNSSFSFINIGDNVYRILFLPRDSNVIKSGSETNINFIIRYDSVLSDSLFIVSNIELSRRGLQESLHDVVYKLPDIEICSAVLNETIIPNISISPNPCVDKIQIRGVEDNVEVILYSADGKMIKQHYGSNVDLSYLSRGLYFLKIQGRIFKVVKQ